MCTDEIEVVDNLGENSTISNLFIAAILACCGNVVFLLQIIWT